MFYDTTETEHVVKQDSISLINYLEQEILMCPNRPKNISHSYLIPFPLRIAFYCLYPHAGT